MMLSKTFLLGLIIMGILSTIGLVKAAQPLEIGATAPAITATNEEGAKVDFASVYAKGLTLVYFYPKSDTPGCTAEACSIRDGFMQIQQEGIQVIGVSHDSVAAQKKFKEKYQLPYTLIADTDGAVMKAFGVPTFLGFATRQSFLIKEGKIVWRDLKASTSKQAADVLKAAEDLK